MASSAETERFAAIVSDSKELQLHSSVYSFLKGHLLPKTCFTPQHCLTGDSLLSCYGEHCHHKSLPSIVLSSAAVHIFEFTNVAVHGEGEQCRTNAIRTMIHVEASSSKIFFIHVIPS